MASNNDIARDALYEEYRQVRQSIDRINGNYEERRSFIMADMNEKLTTAEHYRERDLGDMPARKVELEVLLGFRPEPMAQS